MNARSLLMMAALAVWCGCLRPAAAEVSADFAAANKMYAEGKFTEAAGAYEQIIPSTGRAGPASESRPSRH